MASRIVQYFADKLKSMKEYPITLTKAVYDESGKRLDNKLSEIDNSLSDINSNLDNKYKFVTLAERINGEGTIHELSESITNFRYLLFELVSANISYNIVMQSVIIPVEHFRGDILNKVAFEMYVTQRDYCHVGYTNDTRVTVTANNNTNLGVTILGIK